MQRKRTAPEIIGFHLGWDIRDVSEGRYQSTRYATPGVYVCGEDYFCSPSGSQKPPAGFDWAEAGEYYGRKVYRAKPERAETRPRAA